MINLPYSNKGWKKYFVCIRSLNGFRVSLGWKVAKDDGNRMFGVLTNKRDDLDKIMG